MIRFLSVCSGIEAASVAWHPIGWECAAVAEVEPFPSAVLAHHYPSVPNLGDITAPEFTERAKSHGPVQLLVGGTPCQSFSVAGLRKGLADPRGGLTLRFLEIARDLRPRWVVWENVPGILSADGGRAFGAFLGGLAEIGYGWTYRVLDAQYFGIAQSRRRVFVVGCLGDWRRSLSVLLERESLQGIEQRQAEVPREVVSNCVPASGFRESQSDNGFTYIQEEDGRVRNFTPLEIERLQGFPDGYTDIDGATDKRRYKALGNSMPVPVMRWIGERIQVVE